MTSKPEIVPTRIFTCNRQHAVASLESKKIAAGAAAEPVRARAAGQGIGTICAVQSIRTRRAANRIDVGSTIEQVAAACSSDDRHDTLATLLPSALGGT